MAGATWSQLWKKNFLLHPKGNSPFLTRKKYWQISTYTPFKCKTHRIWPTLKWKSIFFQFFFFFKNKIEFLASPLTWQDKFAPLGGLCYPGPWRIVNIPFLFPPRRDSCCIGWSSFKSSTVWLKKIPGLTSKSLLPKCLTPTVALFSSYGVKFLTGDTSRYTVTRSRLGQRCDVP